MLSLLCVAPRAAYENRLVFLNTLYYDVKRFCFSLNIRVRETIRINGIEKEVICRLCRFISSIFTA